MNANKGVVLRGLQDSLTEINEEVGELTLQQIRTLAFIMRRGSVTGTEIMAALDLSRPTTSRIVAALSNEMIGRRQAAPLDLVSINPDPVDRRVRHIVLTTKGQKLAESIVEMFKL